MKASQDLYSGGFALKPCWTCEEGQHYYKVHKPRRDFPYVDGDDIHK